MGGLHGGDGRVLRGGEGKGENSGQGEEFLHDEVGLLMQGGKG